MATQAKVARRKLSLLELAHELGNVSKACKVMGYSRQQFYEIRRNYQTYGSQGLIDRLPGARGPPPKPSNRRGRKSHPGLLPEESNRGLSTSGPRTLTSRHTGKLRWSQRCLGSP